MKHAMLEQLGAKEITAENLAKRVKTNLDLLPAIFEGVSSKNSRIRYGCAKILNIISEEHSEQLYPKWDFFAKLLDSDKKILKWNALIILANLASVDSENRFSKIFEKYFERMNDGVLVTVANVVGNSGKIAKVKPHLTERITSKLLSVEKLSTTPHLTEECKNILMGKAILALTEFFDQIKRKDDVILFVRRQLGNTRNATRKKAEEFLQRFERQS